MAEEFSNAYTAAQKILLGVLSKKLVLNDTVFPHWIRNSDFFWYECQTIMGKDYVLVDARNSIKTAAFDHELFAQALQLVTDEEVAPLNLAIKIIDIELSPRKVRFLAFDRHWLYEEGVVCTVTECVEIDPEPKDSLISPDGEKALFIKGYNLWLKDLFSGWAYPLTQDGVSDYPYAIVATPAGFPATSALQAIWSPDSKRVMTYQLDLRGVASRPKVHHVPTNDIVRPTLSEHTAAYPGDESVESYRIVAIDIESAETVEANYRPIPICRAGAGFFSQDGLAWWSTDSLHAFFVEVARGSTAVRFVKFNTVTGDTVCVGEETSDTYLKLNHNLLEPPLILPLVETNELIFFSERSGWGHLYLLDLDARQIKNPITYGDWVVREILYFDAARRELTIQASGRNESVNPYYRDVCRVNIDTGKIVSLIEGPFDHLVTSPLSHTTETRAMLGFDFHNISGISENGDYIVVTRSRVDTLPTTLLIDRCGCVVMTLETAEFVMDSEDWYWPEPVKLTASDCQTDLYGVVYRPPNYSPDQQYPVIDISSCCPVWSFMPQGSFSNGPFLGIPYLNAQALASLGFIVVQIEGRGTPFRNKSFQEVAYGSLANANALDDRISGLRQLAKYNDSMNMDQVGVVSIYGFTGAIYGLLEHPKFYKVGVMLAMGDSRYDLAPVVEMFEDPYAGLVVNYPEDLVSALEGKLFLVHGMLDTEVPPTSTLRLIEALQRANKDFEMLLLPSDHHDMSSYALRRIWDFLVRNLLKHEPPKEFSLTQSLDELG